MLSSGTVGGAVECALGGVRGVAVSIGYFERLDVYGAGVVEDACEVGVDVVLRLWEEWGVGVEWYNVNIPLGCKRDVAVYHTHLLQDHYGPIYAPASYRQLTHSNQATSTTSTPTTTTTTNAPTDPSTITDTTITQEILTSPLPLPSSPTLPPPTPTLSANGSKLAEPPIVPMAVPGVGGGVAELGYGVDYRFNIDMFREWSSVVGYDGSDYHVVKSGYVSVSALRCSFVECDWTSGSYRRYGEEGRQQDDVVAAGSSGSAVANDTSQQRKSAL